MVDSKVGKEWAKRCEAIKVVRAELEKSMNAYTDAMKTGDRDAARKAMSTESDIANLDRLIKRIEAGYHG